MPIIYFEFEHEYLFVTLARAEIHCHSLEYRAFAQIVVAFYLLVLFGNHACSIRVDQEFGVLSRTPVCSGRPRELIL